MDAEREIRMSIQRTDMSSRSEDIRLRYLYRNLILHGKSGISLESARGLIGPDCAYHLYGIIAPGEKHDKRRVREK